MKNIISFLLLIQFLVSISFAQSFWKQIRPAASSNHYYAVHMFDSTTIWGFGQAGMMLYTEDFGENWQAYYKSGFQETIFSCYFFNSNRGVVVGERGAIYETLDQCKTWQLKDSKVKSSLKSVKFIEQYGVAVGENGTIIKSEDEGQSWFKVDFKGRYNFNSVSLLSKKHWFIVGNDGVIVETKTAGKTWKVKFDKNRQKLDDIHFINHLKGFISSTKGLLLTTLDGGKSWKPRIIARKRDLYQIKFIDDKNGLIAGEGGIVERTFDGGIKWADRFSAGVLDLYALDLWDIDHGILLGAGGNRTLITQNAYRFFTDVFNDGSSTISLNAIATVNRSTLFTVGDNGQFMRLEDNGDSSFFPSSKTPQDFNDVFFANRKFGWAVGQDGEVRISANGGKSWMYQYSGIKYEDLKSVYFINENTGWIVGEKGTMLQTYNMGTNWNKYESGIKTNLNSVNFTDDYNGFIVGDSGLYMTTSNGGNFWEKQFFPSNADLKEILVNNNLGYVITKNGELFRTFNKGENWQQVLLNSNLIFNSVFSVDNFTWLVGNKGKVLYTNNKFFDWTDVFSTTIHNLNDIHFYDFNTGYACGEFGTILRFSSNKSTLDSTVTKNGGAVFNLKIPQDQHVKGILLNLDGNPIQSIINKNYKQGDYSFYIPAQEYNLDKGIYFLKLSMGDKTSIKKVVVF